MPLIPILVSAIPGLIKLAESVFGASEGDEMKGPMKKTMVLRMLAAAYDSLHVEKILPDFPNVNEKQLVLDMAGVLIDNLVPELTK